MHTYRVIVVAFACAALLLVGLYFAWREDGADSGQLPEAKPSEETGYPGFPATEDGDSISELPDRVGRVDTPIAPQDMEHYSNLFEELRARLETRHDKTGPEELLAATFEALRSLPADEAADEIRAFLESGWDVATGLAFRVGRNGALREAPTMRVAALDWFGELEPQSAYAYAVVIFESSADPDEWAVALRNYGRFTEPGSDSYFTDLIRRFIRNPDWRHAPTAGYAEGFDAVVYNRHVDLIAELAALHRDGGPLRTLAGTVLDNLVRQDREPALSFIRANSALFESSSHLRATLMARADPRSARQADWIEAYLLDSRIPLREKQTFLDHFPHFSGFHAHRLLTRDAVLPLQTQAEIDRAALHHLRRWAGDERFEQLETPIAAAESRLTGFLASAVRGGIIGESE